MWEITYYYLCETRDISGSKVKIRYESEIRRLIITDSKSWFLINAQDLDKICEGYTLNEDDIEALYEVGNFSMALGRIGDLKFLPGKFTLDEE